MLKPLSKAVSKIYSNEKYFLLFLTLAILAAIPVTVYAILSSRTFQSRATHQDCFDVTGDFRVTAADSQAVQNHFGTYPGKPGYDPKYNLDHQDGVSTTDLFIINSHQGEVCSPKITFSANPSSVNKGSSSRLSWSVQYATSVSISNIGGVATSGSRNVSPGVTTTYVLSASNQWTSKQASVKVNVVVGGSVSSPGGGGGGSSGSGSTGSQGVLKEVQLKISVPYLIGQIKLPVNINGKSKEIGVSGPSAVYKIGVSGDNFQVGKDLSVIVGGNKVLAKKAKVTPSATTAEINLGGLVIGDLNDDNRIDEDDQKVLIDSISNQTNIGDINADSVVNSFDWAIILLYLGKSGN